MDDLRQIVLDVIYKWHMQKTEQWKGYDKLKTEVEEITGVSVTTRMLRTILRGLKREGYVDTVNDTGSGTQWKYTGI